ncbi:hypothetical protein BVG16_01230 [Paenibacillus selenitireducens]|uniref:Uncharacterized protein n=1 Tax=Paenibacillus selenitireducens TaxID=1324314 RepID=A0A1T2XMF7_9BACL|nr:hypothetical protein [Paenibacillus selenitireducens]OPA80998.1 hypothetical protein BVG16_01230 [Paenibacillus selenitireducens]
MKISSNLFGWREWYKLLNIEETFMPIAHTLSSIGGSTVIEYSDRSVGLYLDTAWTYVCGINPIDWIQNYPDRIWACDVQRSISYLKSC